MPRNAPAAHVHGFLTRDGTPPAELLRTGRAEVTSYGGEVVDDRVEHVRRLAPGDRIERGDQAEHAGRAEQGAPGFALELASGRELRARRLLVTTGLRDELPDVPGVRERWGTDVLHCPYCHGWEVRDQPLGVLATSPGAVHQALLVRQWSPDVVVVVHDVTLEPHDRARLAARGVRIVDEKASRVVVEGDRLRGIELVDGTAVPRAAVFVQPRFVPSDGLLSELGCVTGDGGWVQADASGRTSVPGVWAAGNVANPQAQVVTAAGAGSTAAAAINADLVEEEVDAALQT
jgi:thioredoxin reductase